MSLEIDKVNKKFLIANCISNKATVKLYNPNDSKTFTNPTTKTLELDITYFECNIFPTDSNYIICFYLKKNNYKNIHYVIYTNDLNKLTDKEQTTENIIFLYDSKAFHTFFYGTNNDIAICGIEQSETGYIFTSCRMAALKDDYTLEKIVPKGQNYSPVDPCKDEYHNIHYASITETQFAAICVHQQDTNGYNDNTIIYSIVDRDTNPCSEGLKFGEDHFGTTIYKEKYTGRIVKYKEACDEEGFLTANALSGKDSMEISVHGNDDRILLVSRYDNLGKGASGAAVQSLNIMMGIDETTGLI
jgi:hypothetical protein